MHPIQAASLRDAIKATSFQPLKRFAATVTQRFQKRDDRDQSYGMLCDALALSTALTTNHTNLLSKAHLRVAIFSAEAPSRIDNGAWVQMAQGLVNDCPHLEIDLVYVPEWDAEGIPFVMRSKLAALVSNLTQSSIWRDPTTYDIDLRNPDLVLFITPDWGDIASARTLSDWALHIFERGGPMVATCYDHISAEKLRFMLKGLGLADSQLIRSNVTVPFNDGFSPPSSYNAALVDIRPLESPGAFIDEHALRWVAETEQDLMATARMGGKPYVPGEIVEHEGRKLAVGLHRVAVDIATGDTYKVNDAGKLVVTPPPPNRLEWEPLTPEHLPHVSDILDVVNDAFSSALFDQDFRDSFKSDMSDPEIRAKFIDDLLSNPVPPSPHGEAISPERMREVMDIMFSAMAGDSGVDQNHPLFVAAAEDNPEAIKSAVAAGHDVNIQDGESWTPLIECSSRNSAKAARALIELGADVNKQNVFGHTPLSIALSRNSDAVVLTLLEADADLSIETPHGTGQEMLKRLPLSPSIRTWLALRNQSPPD